MTGKTTSVLLLGGGGREHALAWKMAQSPDVARIFALPGNDGMAALAKVTLVPGDPADAAFMLAKAQELKPDLVMVGPEKPLAAGVVDVLEKAGFVVLGPVKAAAQLESSKIFAKEFMSEFGVPTAPYRVCNSYDEALDILKLWPVESKGVVIKADGLAAGKGVVVTHDRAEAEKTLHDFMINPECQVKSERILLEEKLTGREVSAFALCDGNTFLPLGFVCDYKRVRDNDQGPNTGGMGGYAPQGWPSAKARRFVAEKIFAPVIKGMQDRGTPYRGILFAGLMVEGDDVKVIEFNTRFGDPETQILMPLIDSDIVPLFAQAAAGELGQGKIALKEQAAVHVVMASEGYPETFGTGMTLGQKIDLPENMLNHNVNDNGLLFVMGAKKKDGRWTNEGGRVLGVTALAGTMEEARDIAYRTISAIRFKGAHWRKDIGKNS
ncbi:MAG: phosphoribosylamine--glycine ligase [Alphaproteobacteria bacterium]|nr:MAG: phosphoribosylamine--glycine ligase [Alphaproteobacteria bacterium]